MVKLENMFTAIYVLVYMETLILIMIIMYYSKVIMCYSGVTIRPLHNVPKGSVKSINTYVLCKFLSVSMM